LDNARRITASGPAGAHQLLFRNMHRRDLILFTTAPNFPVTPGFQAGSQRLDQTIGFTDPRHFTSDAVTAFFDATGQKYRQGCATALGERFE
jgi:hypothetical protein